MAKILKKRDMKPLFENYEVVAVIERKGCSVIGDPKLIICDLDKEFPWYLFKGTVLVIFKKCDKRLNL